MEYIKKLFKRILLKSEKCICPHYDIRYVIIRDYLYDEMTDNDDLEDIPTLIKITYCYDCGKILKKERFNNFNYFMFSNYLSSDIEIERFYKKCGITNRNEVTLYNNKLREYYDYKN